MSRSNNPVSELTQRYWGFIQYTNVKAVLLFIAFTVVSVYAVTTSSGSEMYEYIFKGKGSSPIVKHLLILAGCYITVGAMALVPLSLSRYVRSMVAPIYIFASFILVWLLPFLGVEINGTTRWIYLFGLLSVQPSEFCKLGFIFALSLMSCLFLERSSQSEGKYWRYYGMPFVFMAITIAIIAYTNMSTAIIFVACTAILLFIYKMPFRWLVSTGAVGGSLLALVLVIAMSLPDNVSIGRLSTFKARMERSLEEKSDTLVLTDKNRQEYYANIAIANSKFFGRGISNSEIKDILPMAMSDYVFAVMIEEGGIFAIILVPSLYIAWFWLILGIARKEEDRFFRYVLYGIGVFYPFQALINFVVVSGIITTGQPLPFLSSGGSSVLSNSISFGLVLMISRWQTERKLQAAIEDTPVQEVVE